MGIDIWASYIFVTLQCIEIYEKFYMTIQNVLYSKLDYKEIYFYISFTFISAKRTLNEYKE